MTEEIQNIPLDQIDAPKVPMRSDVHDEGIEELASSIRNIGLLQPVILRVVHVGETETCKPYILENGVCNFSQHARFEIIVGHRRVTAARLAGLVTIAAIVRALTDSEATVSKLHENLMRRDVNPVDESIFLAKIMQEEGLDMKQVVELTKRSEAYISGRLEILHYPDYLIEAVGEKQVSLGAAHWLDQILDEHVRRNYVSYAISGGISVKRAIAWYESWKIGAARANPLQAPESEPETDENREPWKEVCMVCEVSDLPKEMTLVYAHKDCVAKIHQ